MENFKEIAEKCLAGELSGTFVLRNGGSWKSNTLSRYSIAGKIIPGYYVLGKGLILDSNGLNIEIKERVQNFIPDNMQEQIKIDIPEGKVPVMEQTEKGVVITWEEKLTFSKIYNDLVDKDQQISSTKCCANYNSQQFNKKIEVLRKLTNIRNYFGGDKPTNSWLISIDSARRPYVIENPRSYRESCFIYFDTKEHAEQAIKMLGDELKYLFEPW